MPSTTTLYVDYFQTNKLIDQTVGFGFRADELYPNLGNPATAQQREKLNGADPLTWLQGRYQSSANCGWAESEAGQYTPRFYRGGYNYGADQFMRKLSDPEAKEAMRAEEQIDIFETDLIDIGRTVTPSAKTRTWTAPRFATC